VVAGIERQRPDRVALLVGDFMASITARRIAGARRRDRSVEGSSGAVRKGDLGQLGGEHGAAIIDGGKVAHGAAAST
jgi:hypothetical protein